MSRSLVASTLLIVTMLGANQRVHAQSPTYDLFDLGDLPTASSPYAFGVNDHGVVVGFSTIGGIDFPFVASATQPATFLPLLPGDFSGIALGINDAGVIVGKSENLASSQAVIWTPTPTGYAVTALPPTLTGEQPTAAQDLNELGDVVGGLDSGEGFWWSASGGTVNLATFGVDDGSGRDVNESRQVVAGMFRVDLDTGVVDDAQTMLPAIGSFTHVNDAGVASTLMFTSFPIGTQGGIFDFTSGWTAYGAGAMGFVAGIDYATNVLYQNSFGAPGVGVFLHVDGRGEFALNSLLDPAHAAWTITLAGAMSPGGLIAARATKAGVTSNVLLVPQKFHAILAGAPSVEGLPVLVAAGSLVGGSPFTLKLSRAAPSAPVGLIAGLWRVDLPFYGGTLVPAPTLVLTGLSTDANGKLALTTTWPNGLPSGTMIYVQEWIADASAPFGIAGSNALECVVP